MRRAGWAGLRVAGGLAVLAVIGWRLGTGPFVAGIQAVTAGSIVLALAVTAVTTLCSAWRWRLVARGFDVDLPLPEAFAAYYRSQLLNSTLPAGVLGDVDRAVGHGRMIDEVGRSVRAVVWERAAGQFVQLGLTVVVLVALPSPARPYLPIVLAGAAVTGVAVYLALRPRRLPDRSRSAGIVAASIVVVAGHTAIFVLAARTAGTTVSTGRLVPLAMLVLLAMALPTSVGGWGPREGAAAALFAAAGLGAQQGVEVATVYGVLALAATLPGAVVLILAWMRRRQPHPAVASTVASREAVLHG